MSDSRRLGGRLLREPLVHFLVLGAALFIVFGWKRGPALGERDIVVTPGRVEQIAEGFQRVWNRPPTRQELDGLIDDFVLEEIYYREALALGLEEDDTIIRRRLRQKMEFLAEEGGDGREPAEEDLQSFLEEHPDRFRIADRLTLDQVYVSVDKRGEGATAEAERVKRALAAAGADVSPDRYGDPFLLPHRLEMADVAELNRMFGAGFGDRVRELPVGSWEGPVESGYGLHVVRLRELEPGRLPALAEVREQVRTEWEVARRSAQEEDFEERLRAGYRVTIDWPEWARPAATVP